jgi:putative oxidoreductase
MNQVKEAAVEAIPGREGSWWVKLIGCRGFVLGCRLLMAAMFLVSSLGKLVDIERYSVDAVYNFGILPMVLARPFGLVMPFIELLCGLGLLFGVLTRLAALGIGLMSISFFIAKALVLSQGRSIECGCFGAVIDTLASVTIFMDIPMVFFAWVVMAAPPAVRHWASFGRMLPEPWKEKMRLVW